MAGERDIEADLSAIARQEAELLFDSFDADAAWRLGITLRSAAESVSAPVAIDISLGNRQLFFCAMPGATPDNANWIRRKRNVTLHFHRSSYAVGLELLTKSGTLEERYALPAADYAAHGGAFPISVHGTGVIGVAVVSGLPQRRDHDLVVEALCRAQGKDPAAYALAS